MMMLLEELLFDQMTLLDQESRLRYHVLSSLP